MKRISFFITVVVLALLALIASASISVAQGPGTQSPQVPQAQVGTAFTYQGQLKTASGPVTGSCDLAFRLYDDASVGSLVGSAITSIVPITNGLFATQLDFGVSAFTGEARWLQIAVRCPTGGGNFTVLVPRQPLTPAPYSLYSANADTLDGQHAAAFQQHSQNLLVVAKSGGDFTTITAALGSITTASAANPFTIYVAPGIYSERVVMKPYVDIEGAGEQATKVTYIGSSYWTTGTVVGANNAELRFLTVENTGGYSFATAIYNDHASPRLTHVTAIAAGGISNSACVDNEYSSPAMTNVTVNASGVTHNLGVYNYGPSSPVMTNVTARTSGGTANYGVLNEWYSSPKMMGVTATASGGTDNYSVYSAPWSSPTMIDVIASASGGTNSYGVYSETSFPITMTNVTATAQDGENNYGVYNNTSSPTMVNVTANTSGGTNNYGIYNKSSSPKIMSLTASATGGSNNYGMWNNSSAPTIQNSTINASGGTLNDGIHNDATSGSYTVQIKNSQITGGTSTIYQTSQYTTRVGASQIAGGGAFGSTYTCVASYNANYTALDTSCH